MALKKAYIKNESQIMEVEKMDKKKMALCTPIPEDKLSFIKEYCEVTVCGELKHGKGNVTEEMTKEECMGNEMVVLGDEYAGGRRSGNGRMQA